MLCVHNTDKPYYCEKCKEFFKIKTEYQEHVENKHPGEIPDDLQAAPLNIPPTNITINVDTNNDDKVEESTKEPKKTPQATKKSTSKNTKTSTPDLNQALPPTVTIVTDTIEDKKEDSDYETTMPMEKMRTLLALLLKKISTPGRLKKTWFWYKVDR